MRLWYRSEFLIGCCVILLAIAAAPATSLIQLHALLALPLSLVPGVHSQAAGSTLRVRSPTLSNRNARRGCNRELRRTLPVSRTPAQVVEMRHGDLGQTRIFLPPEHLPLPFQDPPRRWSAQSLMGSI